MDDDADDDVGQDILLEAETIGTVAAQLFEAVTEQATMVQSLCEKMEEQSAMFEKWNEFVRAGKSIADQVRDQMETSDEKK